MNHNFEGAPPKCTRCGAMAVRDRDSECLAKPEKPFRQVLIDLAEFSYAVSEAIARLENSKDVAWRDVIDKQAKLADSVEKLKAVL